MAGLRGYVIKRIMLAPVLLLVITLITYASASIAVGDPITLIFGRVQDPDRMVMRGNVPPGEIDRLREQYEVMRRELGLDHPVWIQYLIWLAHMSVGDFGTNWDSGKPVAEEMLRFFPSTLQLTTTALLFATLTGVIVGIVSAIKHNQKTDRVLVFLTLTLYSTPTYWLAFILIKVIAVDLLPLHGGFITPIYRTEANPIGRLVIPAISMGVASAGFYARITRSSMLEVIRQDYITTARSKGLSEKVVIYKHALKNALIPVVTVIGLSISGLFGGSLIMETIFAWPGMGRYGYEALVEKNYPVIMGVVLFSSTLLILMNLVVDIVYAYLDPRIRYG
ncbi:MAG: ABC transporter permease [Candidatus Hodarchaeales archaeon]|jgi:peptide/nickel transport system permease protein